MLSWNKAFTRKREGRKENANFFYFRPRSVSKFDDTMPRIKDLSTIGKVSDYLESFYTSEKELLEEDKRINCIIYAMRWPF